MLFREFAVLKVKPTVRETWEFPFSLDEAPQSPFAGSFDEVTAQRLDVACGHLPFATRTHDGRRAWNVGTPARGSLEVWFTSDGSLFVEGETTLNVVYALFMQLLEVEPNLALEDRITGELHDRASLLRLVRGEEQRSLRRLSRAAELAA